MSTPSWMVMSREPLMFTPLKKKASLQNIPPGKLHNSMFTPSKKKASSQNISPRPLEQPPNNHATTRCQTSPAACLCSLAGLAEIPVAGPALEHSGIVPNVAIAPITIRAATSSSAWS